MYRLLKYQKPFRLPSVVQLQPLVIFRICMVNYNFTICNVIFDTKPLGNKHCINMVSCVFNTVTEYR